MKSKDNIIEFEGIEFKCFSLIEYTSLIQLLKLLAKKSQINENQIKKLNNEMKIKDQRLSEIESLLKIEKKEPIIQSENIVEDDIYDKKDTSLDKLKDDILNQQKDNQNKYQNDDDDNNLTEKSKKNPKNISSNIQSKSNLDDDLSNQKGNEGQYDEEKDNEGKYNEQRDNERIDNEGKENEAKDNEGNNNDKKYNDTKENEDDGKINGKKYNEEKKDIDESKRKKERENLNDNILGERKERLSNMFNVQNIPSYQNTTNIENVATEPSNNYEKFKSNNNQNNNLSLENKEMISKLLRRIKILETQVTELTAKSNEHGNLNHDIQLNNNHIDEVNKNLDNLKDNVKDIKNKLFTMNTDFDKVKVKVEDFNVYDLFKGEGKDGVDIDAAKILIMNLENKMNKRFDIMEEKNKNNEKDIFKIQEDLKNTHTFFEGLKSMIKKIENF